MLNLLLGIGRHFSSGKWKLDLTNGYGHIAVETFLEDLRVTNVINKRTHKFYVEKTDMRRITQDLKQRPGLPTTYSSL